MCFVRERACLITYLVSFLQWDSSYRPSIREKLGRERDIAVLQEGRVGRRELLQGGRVGVVRERSRGEEGRGKEYIKVQGGKGRRYKYCRENEYEEVTYYKEG